MYRQKLRTYKGMLVTADVAEALRLLEARASERGKWRVRYHKPTLSFEGHRPESLRKAGREIQFSFERAGASRQEGIHAAWGCAVPLGFTPHNRYPWGGPDADRFYYFGPWKVVNDHLLAEGRGHLAWPSVCCAAQADIGAWEGGQDIVRFVQAQLHRVGRNPGAVDGVLGPRTALAIESLNLDRGSLPQVAEHLRTAEPMKNLVDTRRGHLMVPGHQLTIQGHGGVKAWPMRNGAGIQIDGPGRLVVDVR